MPENSVLAAAVLGRHYGENNILLEYVMDRLDRKILRLLQEDSTLAVADVAKKVGLSTTPCWRRIQKLEEEGVIKRRVAILDPEKINARVTVFVSIRTNSHSHEWLRRFSEVIQDFPEVIEFYRMSGDVDYLLRVVVPDIAAYDAFYKRLIAKIEIRDVSSSFAMEQIKYTTELPLDYMTLDKESGAPARRESRLALSRQPRQQRGRVPALAAHRLDVLVELVDERGDRQLGAVAVGLGEADAEILAHPVDGEAEIVLAGVHRLVAVLHLPGAGRALGDDVDHLLDVEPGLLAEMDAFGQSLDEAGDADLVDHLGELAGAGRAHQPDHAGIGVDDRPALSKSACVAADHHGQHAVLGAGLAAGDRRVEKAEAALRRPVRRVRARPRPRPWCCR